MLRRRSTKPLKNPLVPLWNQSRCIVVTSDVVTETWAKVIFVKCSIPSSDKVYRYIVAGYRRRKKILER